MTLTMPNCHTSEQLICATLRLLCDEGEAMPEWHVGLRAARLPESAIVAFHNMFFLVKSALPRPLRICGLRCVCMGGDEIALLRVISLLQRDKADSAKTLVDEWLPRSAARRAMPYMKDVADALSGRGLRLPLRHPEFGTTPIVAFVQANVGLALVH